MLLENDIVQPSNSPYSNNLVLVKKKDGSTRTCVDFRRLNFWTRFDATQIARIDESLDLLSKARLWLQGSRFASSYTTGKGPTRS